MGVLRSWAIPPVGYPSFGHVLPRFGILTQHGALYVPPAENRTPRIGGALIRTLFPECTFTLGGALAHLRHPSGEGVYTPHVASSLKFCQCAFIEM